MQPRPCEETCISNMNNSYAGTVGLPVKHMLTLQLVNDSGKPDSHKKKAMLPKSSSKRGSSRLQTEILGF